MVRHESEIIAKCNINKFKYRKMHMIRELTEAAIVHFLEKPLSI